MKKRAVITVEVVYDDDKTDPDTLADALNFILTDSYYIFDDDHGAPTFHGFEAGADLPEKD